MDLSNIKIALIGLGYVGLPLAIEFGKKYPTLGFDINKKRISELKNHNDNTFEVSDADFKSSKFLTFTSNVEELRSVNVYIITVPTPINEHKQPDLTPLLAASKTIGQVLKDGDVVIYESTVYPGATEEDCIPVLEQQSGLKLNLNFFVGYSPERINPGDKQHRVTNIAKVTSGSNEYAADFVDKLYASIITVGTHRASSIRVAEASKILENVQRDVNIALINEAHQIFCRLGINTSEVIDVASTKWNFVKLHPGLVGGHCIGVDPYYLLHKSQSIGYVPDLMRKAREINDGFPDFVFRYFIEQCLRRKVDLIRSKVIILGAAFKENCPDFRNTKVVEVYKLLLNAGITVEIFDNVVNADDFCKETGIKLKRDNDFSDFDIGLLCVKHNWIIDNLVSIKADLSTKLIIEFR